MRIERCITTEHFHGDRVGFYAIRPISNCLFNNINEKLARTLRYIEFRT
ncbi:hypothetical protein N181_30220 [Sinorhizobium fredii USDA 205]|nr:hypothetical protein N181_30220 [Sinorhizobium fredii USDA 205]